MKLRVRNLKGKVVKTVQVRDDVFGVPMKEALVHQVVVGQLANARQGTASVKTRAQVSGGGAKPHPQKGTGRARQGTIRSPLLRGGGVVFGPTPRSYRHHTTRRAKRRALTAVLSDKVSEDRIVVVDKLALDAPKTREMEQVLNALDAGEGALLVADGAEETVLRAARNIPRLRMLPAALLNPLDVLNAPKIVMTLDAVRAAEKLWGGRFVRTKGPTGPTAAKGLA